MSNALKPDDVSRIPAALRDWLDNAIISHLADSQAATENTLNRRASIANAILYPLENAPRKAKTRASQ